MERLKSHVVLGVNSVDTKRSLGFDVYKILFMLCERFIS